MPTFPNARYIFSAEELKVWEQLHAKRPNQALVDSVLPIVAAGAADLVKSDYAVDDEVWLESSPGHTPDHFCVRLASQGHDAVVTGDMIHSPIQCLYPEWIVRPDFDKPMGAETRRSFLERYADTSTLVCTMHFPYRRSAESNPTAKHLNLFTRTPTGSAKRDYRRVTHDC